MIMNRQLPNTFRLKHQTEWRMHLSNCTTIKTLQVESQKGSFFPKHWPNGYPKYKFHQDMHAKIYNDRNSKKL